MKILLVGDYPPPYGGVSVQVAVLHRRLSALPGVTCRALDIGKSRSLERRECIPARHPPDLAAKLLRHAANGYTIHLHTNGHNRKSWLMSLACAAAGCLNRRRTVLTFGSGLAPDFMARADAPTRLVIRGALRLGGAIVCRNERARDAMLRLGASAEKIAILSGFYGVDLAAAAPMPPEVEWFIGQHSPVVGAIASLGAEYGIPLFVKAAARLRPRYPGLGVLLIGAHGVDAHGLDGDLLLTGEQPHGVVLSLLRGLDLFARPTYFDGDASSVREALALGVPVVASDTDFRPEGVVRFRRGDVDDLADKMARTLREPAAPPPRVVEPQSLPKLLAIYDGLQSSAPLMRRVA